MPLSANTTDVTILDDSASHVIAKLQFFQNTANATSHEASTLKINADALSGRTMTLTGPAVASPGFIQGEAVTDANGVTGYVLAVTANAAGNTILHVVLANTTPFANSVALTGARSGSTFTANNAGAVRDPAVLSVKSIWWSISGNSATRVALEWGGTPNTEIIALGSGCGYMGRNALGTRIPNSTNAATGHLLVSTYSTPALSGYSIIVELGKEGGFAAKGSL